MSTLNAATASSTAESGEAYILTMMQDVLSIYFWSKLLFPVFSGVSCQNMGEPLG